jgi:cytochrome P450
MSGLVRQYGSFVHIQMARNHLYLLSRPADIREVLVVHADAFHQGNELERTRLLVGNGLLTLEGEAHRKARLQAQPAFRHQQVTGYSQVIVDASYQLSDSWQDGAVLDIAKEMRQLALLIIGRTLFAAEVRDEAETVLHATRTAIDYFNWIDYFPLAKAMFRVPPWLPTRFRRAKADMQAIIYHLIEARRKQDATGDDLLSLLIQAHSDPDSTSRVASEQLRDEAMTMFLAGYETLSAMLTWSWYAIARTPGVDNELHTELASILAGRMPTVSDIPKLQYTRMVLAEVLRVYPPVWVIGRRARRSVSIGGYTIPSGAYLAMSQYLVHHDPANFAEPTEFNPERWRTGASQARPRLAYFPFGAGTRTCLGEPLAWIAGTLALAVLAQTWELKPCVDKHPRLDPRIALHPVNGMTMQVRRRVRGEE